MAVGYTFFASRDVMLTS